MPESKGKKIYFLDKTVFNMYRVIDKRFLVAKFKKISECTDEINENMLIKKENMNQLRMKLRHVS